MYIFENRITIESRPILEEYLSSYEYKASGLSFSSLYMWRDINHFSWQIIGDYVCIAGISHLELDKEEMFLFPPLTKTGTYEEESLRETILEAKRIFKENGKSFSIRLIPFHMLDIYRKAFPNELRYIDDRPNYDYVYLTDELIKLDGRKYHSMRNHLNFFHNNFKYEYVSLEPNMVEETVQFIREFNLRKKLPEHEMELLRMEEIAIKDVLLNLENVGYYSGAIIIDDKIQAMSIGGRLGRKTVTVHVEKANIEYRGAYQAINNEFCKHMASRVKYINREEDMGILGLRKAKLSYNPVKLVEKYIIMFLSDL